MEPLTLTITITHSFDPSLSSISINSYIIFIRNPTAMILVCIMQCLVLKHQSNFIRLKIPAKNVAFIFLSGQKISSVRFPKSIISTYYFMLYAICIFGLVKYCLIGAGAGYADCGARVPWRHK